MCCGEDDGDDAAGDGNHVAVGFGNVMAPAGGNYAVMKFVADGTDAETVPVVDFDVAWT